MKRRFNGSCLRVQDGEEKYYVSDLPDGYGPNGENLDRAGIFERVETQEGTKGILVETYVGDDSPQGQSAEEKAEEALLVYNEGSLGNKDRVDYNRKPGQGKPKKVKAKADDEEEEEEEEKPKKGGAK